MKTSQSKTSKYGNKKIELDGVKFDSKLELFCYQQLKSLGIEFEFQRGILLQEGFRFRGKAIRPITMIVDFVIHHDGQKIYIDTKGFATETSKLKYKMLKFLEKDDSIVDVIWLHSQKEVKEFINDLLSKDGKL
jgi:protein associated with RNAse G/E